MVDLERRLSEHGALLERDYPTISLTELSDRLDVVAAIPVPASPVRPIQPPLKPLTSAPRWHSLRVALAAVMVGLLIAGVAWLTRGTPDGEVIDQPSVTSIPTPTTTPTTLAESTPTTLGELVLVPGTWSRVPHDEAVFGGEGTQTMSSVTAGGPGLVAVGGDGLHQSGHAAVWTSVDGITWSRVPHDEAVFGGAGEQWMGTVTAGGPGLVAVGWDLAFPWDSVAAVWTSPDGVTWSRVSDDEGVFGGLSYQAMWG